MSEFQGVPGAAAGRSIREPEQTVNQEYPSESDLFATVAIPPHATVGSPSDGDLWPSAWADDGALYAACGDGLGFNSNEWGDVVFNRIDGTPETGLDGQRLASGRQIARVWTDPQEYNSKPTGLVAVDGNRDGRDELYLAVQDLRCGESPDTFNTAPAAGIVVSTDYGHTWSQGEEPMFRGEFTTIMFLDFGRSNSGAQVMRELSTEDGVDPAEYVYAYGLDHNWRTSYSRAVPDPTELFLARVHSSRIQDRQAWEFHTGDGWSRRIEDRRAVLTDTRRVGQNPPLPMAPPPIDGTLIAQGGVVYNAPLRRFIYTSWTEFTFQFYESPTPWGPWRRFLSHDFGPYPWRGPKSPEAHHGGYATTIPSKFISDDGRRMWVQSNWFVTASTATGSSYHFSLRPLEVTLDSGEHAAPPLHDRDLAVLPGAVPIASSCRGDLRAILEPDPELAVDSWNGERRELDFWGVTWPDTQVFSEVHFQSGPHDFGSGWFADTPRLEVRTGGQWVEVDCDVSPEYPRDWTATGHKRYTFAFSTQHANGVRLLGAPAGWGGYSSIARFEVYLTEPKEHDA